MSRRKLFSEVPFIKKGRIELRALGLQDEESLSELVRSPRVYRYLPTFLFEKRYEDLSYVIDHLYDECLEESLIMGIYAILDMFETASNCLGDVSMTVAIARTEGLLDEKVFRA